MNGIKDISSPGYYPLETLDKEIWFSLPQIFFMMFVVAFAVGVDYKILHTIVKKPSLRTQANVLICIILMIETFILLMSSLVAGISLLQQSLWLNQTVCRVAGALLDFSIVIHQYIYTVASFEKFIYIIFPFQLEKWFTNTKLKIYLIVPSCLLGGYNILSCATNKVSYSTYLLSCLVEYNNVLIALYLFFIILAAIFQISIFGFAVKMVRQIRIVGTPTVEISITMNLLRNALVLFSIGLLNIVSLVLYNILFTFSVPFVVGRVCYYYIIFAVPVCDPLIVLLGNSPLRRAIISSNKVRSTTSNS